MYDHIGLKVGDLGASVRFYAAALSPLGHVVCLHDEDIAALGRKDAPAFWLHRARGPIDCGVHVAFRAADHAAVDRFHAAGLETGGRDNGGPGIRADYSPNYYAAFLLDPDGNNIEAVCLG